MYDVVGISLEELFDTETFYSMLSMYPSYYNSVIMVVSTWMHGLSSTCFNMLILQL